MKFAEPGSPPAGSGQSLGAERRGGTESSGSLILLKLPPADICPLGLPLDIPPPLGCKKPPTDGLTLPALFEGCLIL